MRNRIKEIRQALDLTQQEFADRVGIKRSTVANYEIGRNDPVDSVIYLICREFHVNEQWLREGIGDMFVPDPDSELEALAKKYGLSLRQKLLVRHYLELDERQKAAVMQFMFDLVDECRKEEEEEKEPTIDELVEDYRRQLEEERASRGKGGVPKEDTPKKGAS